MAYNPEVWGPHFWFFLQSMAVHYPTTPNDLLKKKYYNLFENLPLFVPHEKIGNDLIELFDKYPVSPYLENRESLLKYIHFIHNKINEKIGKPLISFDEAQKNYYDAYIPKELQEHKNKKLYKKIATITLIIFLIVLVYMGYKSSST